LNVSPTFRRPAQSVPRREFCFRSCTRKAYGLSQSPTAQNVARRWHYAVPRRQERTGSLFGDVNASLIAKGHCRSAQMESRITRTDITGTGCTQKNTDRQTRERVFLSVSHLKSASLPTASDSQEGPHGQPEGPPALPYIPIIDLKLRLVTVGPAGRARRARPRNP